jgi:hypothetical protein
VAIKEWDHPVVEQIGRCDRCLAIVELGADDLGVGVDEGPLVDAPAPLQIADAFAQAAATGPRKHLQPRRLLRFKQKLSVRHVSNRLKSGQIIATPMQKLKVRSKHRLRHIYGVVTVTAADLGLGED